MADQHLRQLQREFEETQSASAEEALLRHKVRLGELSEQGFRLRLLELHWEATGSPADEATPRMCWLQAPAPVSATSTTAAEPTTTRWRRANFVAR